MINVMKKKLKSNDCYKSIESINVTQLGGAISSPHFPRCYPRNVMLSWKLFPPPGSCIYMQFKNFSLEEPVNGTCVDFVEVMVFYPNNTYAYNERWCGHELPQSIVSKGTLHINFKSNQFFVRKGFKLQYCLLHNNSETPKPKRHHHQLMSDFGMGEMGEMVEPVDEVPYSLNELDRAIAPFDTIEELLQFMSGDMWEKELESIYMAEPQILYRSRKYHLASREDKVDLNRLYDDVKRYSCTPRNFSVNIREELRITSAVFFPRCLLVKRCGGNCGCGTDNWNTGCSCQPSKTSQKLHEVLKYAQDMSSRHRHRPRMRWVMGEIFLTHHENCECSCPNQPPR